MTDQEKDLGAGVENVNLMCDGIKVIRKSTENTSYYDAVVHMDGEATPHLNKDIVDIEQDHRRVTILGPAHEVQP